MSVLCCHDKISSSEIHQSTLNDTNTFDAQECEEVDAFAHPSLHCQECIGHPDWADHAPSFAQLDHPGCLHPWQFRSFKF